MNPGVERASRLPAIIQGGMGASVSNWRLAKAVSEAGGLGVVSGTAIDRIVAYRLQHGDLDGGLRRVLATFPFPAIAERVLSRWYIPGGLAPGASYRSTAMIDERPQAETLELIVVANFAEIDLAKEGHSGPIGVNLLEKMQAPNLASLYGALLAGVDAVLMGAGIPREIPAALDRLVAHEEASLILRVEGALANEVTRLRFSPREFIGSSPPPTLRRPPFLAIISSDTLAQALLRATDGQIDGFVVEGATAGGHNAPPRNHAGPLSDRGEPIYGPRDVADLARLRKMARPFWLAGGFGVPGGLARAKAEGAQGVQVGTALAFCVESGMADGVKQQVLAEARKGSIRVFTDPKASPTGFPFKVAEIPGTISDAQVYASRARVCNLGYLREAYRQSDGSVGWRCAAEPEHRYVAKGGDACDTVGRKCLCNALQASAGFPLPTPGGERELPIVTAGDALAHYGPDIPAGGFTAKEIIASI